jgi:hypothetical protein
MLISKKSSHDTILYHTGRRMNHEGKCDGGEDIDLAFEDGRRVPEDAAETVDGQEEERNVQDSTMLVDLVELWPVGR